MAQNFIVKQKTNSIMKKTFLSAFVIASATFFSCGTSGTTSTDKDSTNTGDTTSTSVSAAPADSSMKDTSSKMASTTPVSDMDKQFMMEAGAGGNTEIMASKVALDKATNPRVKAYANMMISDHTKAGDELKSLASQKNVTLPDSVMDKQHKELDDLRGTSTKNFDKAYMKMMDKDHKETIDKFEMAAKKCDDSDVKTFASKTLPTLKMHKDSVDAIQKAL